MIGLFAGVLLLNGSCGSRETDRRVETNVRLVTAECADAASVQDFPGRVVAAEEVNLAFKVGGTLMRLCVEQGSRVKEGDLVAEIDPRDYQVQLDAVEAEYLSVKSEAGRVMDLYADSVVTADAYDKARYGLRQITAKYENARNQLADTKIYAPFDGYVQKRLFDPPTVVAAGMPVVTLISEGSLEIEINIPASTYMKRSEIASFSTSFDFMPGDSISLRLIGMAPKANANQLYTVRLALPRSVSPAPSPGMNAMVNVAFDNPRDEKSKIPSSALFRKEGRSCVWIYDGQSGTIGARDVVVERLDTEGNAIVTQGIAVGERIVAAGVNKLTDGQRVKPLAEATETNVGGLL